MSDTPRVESMKRIFKYNNLILEDSDPQKNPEEVKEFYTTLYPELTHAVIEGPEYEGKNIVFTFARSVGTKGGSDLTIHRAITLEQISKRGFSRCVDNESVRKEEVCLTQGDANQIHKIINSAGSPILLKSSFLPPLP